MAKRITIWLLAMPLAAFFAFVGWNKAFASLADLARYHAWTVWLAEPLGRAIGWSEMLLALAMLLPRSRFWAALLLIANLIAAAGVHAAQGETGALPQNAVLVAVLCLVVWLARTGQIYRTTL